MRDGRDGAIEILQADNTTLREQVRVLRDQLATDRRQFIRAAFALLEEKLETHQDRIRYADHLKECADTCAAALESRKEHA